jgi:acetyltransferase-like isoleucine patch superfamily enzyme
MGRGCWIQAIEVPRNPWDVVLEDEVALGNHIVLLASGERRAEPRIRIGTGTYINRFTMLDASDSIVIGQRCMIGPSCYITDHDHGTRAGQSVGSQPLTSSRTQIGNDVWIGAGAIVLKGVNQPAGHSGDQRREDRKVTCEVPQCVIEVTFVQPYLGR